MTRSLTTAKRQETAGCTPPSITSPTNLLGRRSGMCDAAGAAAWSYDSMGRALTEKRLLNTSVTKTIGYTYNLDGSLATLAYPSGRTITYTPGGAGRALAAKDTANSVNYVTSAAYAPFGGVTGMTSGLVTGAFNGIITTNTYNSRLQPVTLSAATTGTGGQTVLSLGYDFHLSNGDSGNVFQIVNNRDNNRTQNFTYDALNRIASAYSTGPNWGETFTIDPWGNLTNRGPVTGKTSYEALNAPATSSNQISGYCYDIAGNMLGMGSCPGLPYSPTYIYDAENRLRSIQQLNTPWYTYDGDGKRVVKNSSSFAVNRWYWTGVGSDTLTEADMIGTPTADYIYFNGKRVARVDNPTGTASVRYYFSDHLGTASVVTDNLGVIKDESDYYPYGGERTITHTDSNRYKFTGKERDSESGLDYFGARHYASTMGRFMQVDPKQFSLRTLVNPQKWNKYAYVLNNPLALVDPNGMEEVTMQLNAFIQKNSVGGFRGDNRSFSSDMKASSRVSVTVRVETDPAKNHGNPMIGKPEVNVGTTHLNLTGSEKKSTGPQMPQVTATQDKSGNVNVNIQESMRNPFTPPGTGSIKADVNMTVNQDATKAEVSGSISGSPSFEANFSVDGGATQNVPLQSEPSGTYGFISGLQPGNESEIDEKVDLPPPPKEKE